MEKIHIMADSGCGIAEETAKEYGIEILPVFISRDGKAIKEYDIKTQEEFWNFLDEKEELPHTWQITPVQFLKCFANAKENGCTEVLCVCTDAKISGSYSSGQVAAELFYEENGRGMKITMIDSKAFSQVFGAPVVAAAQMRNEGAKAEDIIKYLENALSVTEAVFMICNTKHLKNSGLIEGDAVYAGESIGLFPILRSRNSKIEMISKGRMNPETFSDLAGIINEYAAPGTENITMICGSASKDKISEAKKAFETRFKNVTEKAAVPELLCKVGHDIIGFVFEGK